MLPFRSLRCRALCGSALAATLALPAAAVAQTLLPEVVVKGDKRAAFAILTEEPNELVASYHDRMPLALADDKVALWLDLSQESPPDQNLLLDLTEFTVRPMDRAMNNVRQKNLAAIDPEAEAA